MTITELYAKLGLSVDTAGFKKGDRLIAGLKIGLKTMAATAAAAGTAIAVAIESAAHRGNEMAKASEKIGIGVEALEELAHAADLSDVGFEGLVQGIGFLNRGLLEAQKAGSEESETFKKLGVAAKDAHGKMRPTEDVLGDLADKFAAMPNDGKRSALAMKIFGRAGKDMIPLLKEGRDGIAEMRKEARDMGLVMSEKTTKEAERFSDALTKVKASFQGLANQIFERFGTQMADVVEEFAEFIQIIGQRQEFKDFVDGLLEVSKIALKVAVGVGKAFGAIGTAIGETVGWVVVQFQRFENFMDRLQKRIDIILATVPGLEFLQSLRQTMGAENEQKFWDGVRSSRGLPPAGPAQPADGAPRTRGGASGDWGAPQVQNNVTIHMPPGANGKDVVEKFDEYLRTKISEAHGQLSEGTP